MLSESAVPTLPFFRAASSCSRLAAAAGWSTSTSTGMVTLSLMPSHCAENAPTPAAAVATAAPRAANARAPGVDGNRRAAESMARAARQCCRSGPARASGSRVESRNNFGMASGLYFANNVGVRGPLLGFFHLRRRSYGTHRAEIPRSYPPRLATSRPVHLACCRDAGLAVAALSARASAS